MAETKTFPLEFARQQAANLTAFLQPACHKIEICGSIRRQVRQVHDIDLVVWAKHTRIESGDLFGGETTTWSGPEDLVRRLRLVATIKEPAKDAKIIKFVANGIPVEVYLAEPDGSNFEALKQMRTGSAAYNAWLAQTAQKKHLYYRAGYGIFKVGPDMKFSDRVDDGTERGIFDALKVPWREPPQRF